jgi:hypothetical protein
MIHPREVVHSQEEIGGFPGDSSKDQRIPRTKRNRRSDIPAMLTDPADSSDSYMYEYVSLW